MPSLYPPFAHPGHPRRVIPERSGESPPDAAVRNLERLEAALPNIEQFLDELPSIEDFLLAPELPVTRSEPVAVPQVEQEGWAAADWQSYDWSGLAKLGAPEPEAVEAHAAWASTSWDSSTGRSGSGRAVRGYLAGDEVATALDEIARRIRTGELSLEEFRGTPPEAAIAALFAAFLRTKG